MSQSVAILGRLPALGTAELESLYGPDALQLIGPGAVLIDKAPNEIAFSRLGGTIKLTKLLTILDTTNWDQIEKYLIDQFPTHLDYLDDGKLTLGLSVYGLRLNPKRLNATGLSLKKVVKASGRSCRIVPNKSLELSSAQVLHNKLYGSREWELCFIASDSKTYLVQTTHVQEIDAYAARDQARPKRDARVGMLPPKLAQTIINLATSNLPVPVDQSWQEVHDRLWDVHDPFCGTGVVLQEALLMGYSALGSDLDSRMVEYTQANLSWLSERWSLPADTAYHAYKADATDALFWDSQVIACETYLGRPFSAQPSVEVLREVMSDVDAIHKKFLQNVARQTKPGFRMCIAVPTWRTRYGFTHLKVLDNLGELGYTRAVFKHARTDELVYQREGQIVGRELVVLTRK